MTLSPGQKVQPIRSMRTSPDRFSAFCSSILSERAPRPPRFIGQSTWISPIGSSAGTGRGGRFFNGVLLLVEDGVSIRFPRQWLTDVGSTHEYAHERASIWMNATAAIRRQ